MKNEPIWRCTWCCKDTKTKACEHCGSDHAVSDRTKPHRPEWSRKTMTTVECKVCDREGPYSIQGSSELCNPTK